MNYDGTRVSFDSEDENTHDYYYYYYYGDYEYGEDYHDKSNAGVGRLTPLHIAVRERSTKFVSKLLTVPGILVDLKAEDGETPLFDATRRGYVKIITMLLAAGADIHAVDGYGEMPIHAAVRFGGLRTFKTLVQLGADLDAISYYHQTPLILAVITYHYIHDIAEYLVQMGSDIHVQDIYNMTALDYAIKYQDTDLKKILKAAGTVVATDEQECEVHDEKYPYYDISDLGIAALYNDVDAADDLIMKVRWCTFSAYTSGSALLGGIISSISN